MGSGPVSSGQQVVCEALGSCCVWREGSNSTLVTGELVQVRPR